MSVTDIPYLPGELPARTFVDDLRRQSTTRIVIAGIVCGLVLLPVVASGWRGLGAFIVIGIVYLVGFAVWYVSSNAVLPYDEAEQKWRSVLRQCGKLFPDAEKAQPPVRFLSGTPNLHEVAIKLPRGVAPEKLVAQLSAIANAWEVPNVRVYRHVGGWYRLQLLVEVPPTAPVTPELPPMPPRLPVARSWKAYLSALPVGELHRHTAMAYQYGEDSVLPRPWALPLLGSHVLTAGQTGAGKSSWVQAIISALRAPMAHGAVVLVGIDPKGVELALGRGFFAHYASDYDGICAVLELMVEKMTERKTQMAGKSRLVSPNTTTPMYVIVIDELAAVGKLDVEAKRRTRTQAAMNLILTQGRALGFSVIGAVQDPTKETLPNRDLFNLRVALRLTAPMTDLVLGPKCREEGAGSHLLTADWAGAGYLHDGEGWALVRATWTSDADIIGQASEFRDGVFTGDKATMFLPIDEGTPPPDTSAGVGARRPAAPPPPPPVSERAAPEPPLEAARPPARPTPAPAAAPVQAAPVADDVPVPDEPVPRDLPFVVNLATVAMGATTTERLNGWKQSQ